MLSTQTLFQIVGWPRPLPEPPPFPLFRVPVFRIQSPLPHRYPLTPVTMPLCLSTMGFTLTTHLFSRLEPRCTADSALSRSVAISDSSHDLRLPFSLLSSQYFLISTRAVTYMIPNMQDISAVYPDQLLFPIERTSSVRAVLLVHFFRHISSLSCQWTVQADGPWFQILFISLAFFRASCSRTLSDLSPLPQLALSLLVPRLRTTSADTRVRPAPRPRYYNIHRVHLRWTVTCTRGHSVMPILLRFT